MKITCEVIKDLLPLHLESLTSIDSNHIVEDHLKNCESCRKYKADLELDAAVPIDTDYGIKKVQEIISNRKRLAMKMVILLTSLILLLIFFRINQPIGLPYDESKVQIIESGDVLYMSLDPSIAGYDINQYESEGGIELSITTWKQLYHKKKALNEMILLSTKKDEVKFIDYYTLDHKLNQVIYGVSEYDGSINLPRLALSYYFLVSIFIFLVTAVLVLLLRKTRVYRLMLMIASLPLSYCLAQFALKGFSFSSYFLKEDLIQILIIACIIFCLINSVVTNKMKNIKNESVQS